MWEELLGLSDDRPLADTGSPIANGIKHLAPDGHLVQYCSHSYSYSHLLMRRTQAKLRVNPPALVLKR